MNAREMKMGMLVACKPDSAKFRHALKLATTAIGRGLQVYVYLLDEAVHAVGSEELEGLRERGLKLHACSYAAREKGVVFSDKAVFSGLPVVGDLIRKTDRFLSFT